MNGQPITPDFLYSQLRVALVAVLAYGGGAHWFTPEAAGLYLTLFTALGPMFVPWVWSIVSNLGTIRVSSASAAAVVANVEKTDQSAANRGATVATAAVIKVLLVAFVLSMFLAGGAAVAQTTRKLNLPIDPLHLNGTPVTGNATADMQALWQKIVASSLTDLNYAAAMAASANTTTSGVRLQCIKAIITLNEQASGVNLKNADGSPMTKPDPHLFTDVESLAEIVDNLSPQGPLFVNCAGAAQLAKTNVLSFVNAVVTGAAGFAAMPIIPGL